MSEFGSSSLAITEKRPSRPGGCVGIFFQLFDWNRRFTMKKLLPKKLLPPAHDKQTFKKFGADDKLPKLRLISGEKSWGFPNVKKNGSRNLDSEHKNEMRAPSLVARLMGLDSMPSSQRDKLKKASCSEIRVDRVGKFADDECSFSKDDENLGKTGSKHELRPQKLQKTGACDGQAVTRLGAEALQFKNVLLRSNKCKHHQKLSTPLKSPKSHSGRNTSRLIGAATRILEPGLQSRNREKYALPCSNKMQHTRPDEVMVEAPKSSSQVPSASSNSYDNVTFLSTGKPSCKNCGNLAEIVDSRANLGEQQSIVVLSTLNYVDHPCQGLDRKPRSPPCSLEPNQNINFQRTGENFTAASAKGTADVRPRAESISHMSHLLRVGQSRWPLESQHCQYQQESPSSSCCEHRIPRQTQVLMGWDDGIPANSKFSKMQRNKKAFDRNASNNSTDFVPLHRSSNDHVCFRFPAKLDYSRNESERKLSDKRDGPFSSIRKRRSSSSTRQDDFSGTFCSTIGQQRNINVNGIAEKTGGLAFPSNHKCMESRVAHLGEISKTSDCRSKYNGDIAFTFNSPRKQKSEITVESNGRSQKDSICNCIPKKDSVMNKVSGQACFGKSLPLTGDTLGALLEQKLKKLTSQGNDELALGVGVPRRTSATILQELITALTIERYSHQNDVGIEGNDECESSYCGHTSEPHTTFQNTGVRVINSNDNNYNLSPLSVLEASFSAGSCFSSSRDDSSVDKMYVNFMDCSYNEPRPIHPETDLLDSANSLNIGGPGRETMTDLVIHISEMLCSIGLVDSRLKGSKLAHAEEVIINAELVFGNALQHNKDGTRTFSVSRFLVGELETLASVLWTKSSCFSGFEDTNGNLLKGFLFDCVIEYLESRYGPCFKCGIKTFRNLPLCMNTEMLVRKVVEEIRSWTGLSGFFLDEIIDKEMSCSWGKWADFSTEAFETCAVIDTYILQSLVDEIALDLWLMAPANGQSIQVP